MIVKFYGTRGSIPVSEPGFTEFGGNTTCVLVIGPERVGILDAGSGIRKLGKDIFASNDERFKKPMWMLFSHFHWDHIQGLPFFGPAYDPNREFIVCALGKDRMKQDLRSIFAGQMDLVYFPVSLDELNAKFTFFVPDENQYLEDGARVVANPHSHPGGAYGYRIEAKDGKVLTYCTDVEHGESIDESVVELARNADLLIHEAQYTAEELQSKRGWGHSSYDQAIEVAERAGAKKLAITHHDPDHDDDFLRAIELDCQKRFPDAVLARDGMEIEL